MTDKLISTIKRKEEAFVHHKPRPFRVGGVLSRQSNCRMHSCPDSKIGGEHVASGIVDVSSAPVSFFNFLFTLFTFSLLKGLAT